jgi:hypothetical protein
LYVHVQRKGLWPESAFERGPVDTSSLFESFKTNFLLENVLILSASSWQKGKLVLVEPYKAKLKILD